MTEEFTQQIEINVPKGVNIKEIENAANETILRDPGIDFIKFKNELTNSLDSERKEIIALQNVIKQKENNIYNLEKLIKHKVDRKLKRFNFHHKFIKRIVQKVIPFLLDKFNPYIVKNINDFKPIWYNNLLRIWYWSENKGIDDMWIYMHREMNPQWKQAYKTPSNYLKNLIPWRQKNSDKWAREIIDLQATEILEDSIDREVRNMAVLNQTHEVMKLFGVSEAQRNKVPKPGDFPVWSSGVEYDPKYFITNMNMGVWKEPEPFDYDKEEEEKKNAKNNEKHKDSK